MIGTHSLRAFICGCEGTRLTHREISFFRDTRPCGLILFKRNCDTPDQIRRITSEYREAIGDDDALVLIDQEGGRVQRLQPPNWRQYPPGRAFGAFYERNPELGLEAARLGARLIASDLHGLGITVNCAPVADLPVADAHDVIGNRAYGVKSDTVIALCRAVTEGYLDGGVLPVIKHIPGHGRARVDSHASLPVIDADFDTLCASDFVPFQALASLPLGMTAHILIPDIDPSRPVSTSPIIIDSVIRGKIDFDGLLMCDDLSMGALSGSMAERTQNVLNAGCDVALHCNGDFAMMEAVAAASPVLSGDALRRFDKACAQLQPPKVFDEDRAEVLIADVFAHGLT